MKTDYNEAVQHENSGNIDFPVKFFSIKPGEQAVVRILVDSVADLAAYGYHTIETPDGKSRRIDCIRSLREDIHKCPMCAAEVPFEQQIFIHMLQYYPDGRIEAKTWGRKPPVGNKGTSVVDQIRKSLENYGPLSEYVSSITRTGTGRDTSYTININLPEKLYPPTSFPLDRSAFENYSEEGTIIKNWTAEEMNKYLTTGEIPVTNTNPTFNAETAQPAYQTSAPASPTPSNNGFETLTSSIPESMPWDAVPQADAMAPLTMPPTGNSSFDNIPNTQSVSRPVRRYN